MHYTKDTQIISFFERSKERFSKKETLSPSDIEYLFMSSLDLLNTTYPNQVLLKYFLQPDIASLILYELNNSGLDSIESRSAIQNDLTDIIKKFPRKKSKRFIKFRILDKHGYYPNCDLSRDGIQYTNINQIPTLQTTNYYSSEQQFSNYSEVSWLWGRLQPDHNTISNFRRDNPKAIKKVFRETVKMANYFNLIGGALIAGDSTKFRAQNSKKNNFNQKKISRHLDYIENKLQEYYEALAQSDGDN